MRIVLSYHQMIGFGGTESYIVTVAGALERLGHDVLIHTTEAGPSAEFARAQGARVIENESELPKSCDAVLAQDAATAYLLARRYPHSARVMVVHSTAYPLQSPPQLENVCQAVVVMNDRLHRRVAELAWHPTVFRLRQPIDLQRFCYRALNLEQRRPPRVLWLNNYGAHGRLGMLERACQKAGYELTLTGTPAVPTATPEHEIAQAEIVMTLGRGAVEAMALGRAAYVFGIAGVDGWVTADSYPGLERDGFSGRAFADTVDVERLAGDLSSWSDEMGEVNRDLACRHHDADEHAADLVEMIERLDVSAPAAAPSVADELARLIRLEMDRNLQARSEAAECARARADAAASRRETEAAHEKVAALELAMAELTAQAALAPDEAAGVRGESAPSREELALAKARLVELEATIEALRSSKRYRVGCLIASPLDRLRSRRA